MFRTYKFIIGRLFLYTQHIVHCTLYSCILILKPVTRRCTNLSNFIFGIKLYMFRTEELSEICRVFSKNNIWEISASSWFYYKNLSRCTVTTSWSCSQAVSKPVWHKPLLCVQWKTPDDGQRNCPKYVEFYSKIKFEKLLHLVGFIVRIYHHVWSPERQIRIVYVTCTQIASWWWTCLFETCRG